LPPKKHVYFGVFEFEFSFLNFEFLKIHTLNFNFNFKIDPYWSFTLSLRGRLSGGSVSVELVLNGAGKPVSNEGFVAVGFGPAARGSAVVFDGAGVCATAGHGGVQRAAQRGGASGLLAGSLGVDHLVVLQLVQDEQARAGGGGVEGVGVDVGLSHVFDL
jgi:hypothetical protein